MSLTADHSIASRSNPTRDHDSRRAFAAAATLFVIVAVVFWPACDNGFVNWDDNQYVCSCDEILTGVNGKGLLWAATANVTNNWHPVTLLSLQLDAQLFGIGPRGFHRTSILIHAANAALTVLAIHSLTGALWKSLLVAALFALHPMRVESVAWVSERKDLVSGLFFLLTVLAYVRYVRTRSPIRYVVVATCLALGLASKPMLVTTPCVLLLLDFWPLNRFDIHSSKPSVTLRWLVMEKAPLFVLAGLDSYITILYQQTAIKSLSRFTLVERIGNASYAIGAYVVQSAWPVGLSPFYTFGGITDVRIYAAVLLVSGICSVAFWQRSRQPYLAVGWYWFLGMLVPVCGLIQVGNQSRADRYTYLPHIGFFLAIVWTIAELVRRSKTATRAAGLVCAGYLTGFMYVTAMQIPVWHDTESIWKRAHQIDSANGSIIDFWLTTLFDNGKFDEARRVATEAIDACDVNDVNKMRMLITFLMDLGDNEIALKNLNRALAHHEDDADFIVRKGRTFAALGDWEKAADQFRQASRRSPGSVTYEFFLAHALAKSGEQKKSQQVYLAALRQAPKWADEAANHAWRMSTSWEAHDRRDPFWAVCLAEQANDASGGASSHHLDVLAAAYANAGRFDDAVLSANRALELAEASQKTEQASAIRERRKLYEDGIAFRQAIPPSLGTPVY